MRVALGIAVLAVMSASLAGCLGGSAPPEIATSSTGGDSSKPALPANDTKLNTTALGNDTSIVVKKFNGSVQGVTVSGVASVETDPAAFVSGASGGPVPNSANFDVNKGVTGLVVELVWNGTSDQLSLYVDPPCPNNGSDPLGATANCPPSPKPNTAGKSPAKILVADDKMLNATGSWSYRVFAQQSLTAVPFTVYVSVFYGSVPGDRYSAVPGQGSQGFP